MLLKEDHIKSILNALPGMPGVYQFFNKEGKIIYVGKAKDLKKRVSSYFNKQNNESAKLNILVSKISDIQYIVVDTESDALLLENNLIKKYQPRYNVLLKDDKTFPWICIKNEFFPRVFSTRNVIDDGSTYYGPYTSMVMVRTLLRLIKQLYPLRTCNYDLADEKIKQNKYKACLEYHIGNCKAPCIGLQTAEEYNNNIMQVKNILKGNISNVLNYLKDLIKEYSSQYKFEEAQFVKEKIEIIEKFQSKSTIVNPSIHDLDVFSILDDGEYSYVNFLKVANGAIIQAHTLELKKKLDESAEELLGLAIIEIRQRVNSNSPEILVRINPGIELKNAEFTIPKIGDKLKLLELSERNLHYYIADKKKQNLSNEKVLTHDRILEKMKSDLRLKELPVLIECFDNSNIQGVFPVASCVVFKNAKPFKSEYRHFNIKTVEGPNDFASMEEIVFRRYRRQIDEDRPLPQLIVIDGGKGQLSSAYKCLKMLDIADKIAIIGIAKKLEEIYTPGDQIPLYIDKKSETLKVIQQIRDEAHRFGITFHRDKRSSSMIISELDAIKGIGKNTKELLLTTYKTVENVKKLSIKELSETIGKSKAYKVFKFFLSKKD